jgi:hypothetical protein
MIRRDKIARAPSFTVVDALSGLFRLQKRSPTLRGSVPLRVAQACVPFLEGNAFGFAVTLTERWSFSQSTLGWNLTMPDSEAARLAERYQRARQALLDCGYLRRGDPEYAELDEACLLGALELGKSGLSFGHRPRLRVWTGLLVRPDPGVRLRLFAAANRRSHSFQIAEQSYELSQPGGERDSFFPLIIDLSFSQRTASARSLTISGELACLAPLPSRVDITPRALSERPELGHSHAAFYSPSYFQKKESGPTRRYRRQIDLSVCTAEPAQGDCEIVTAGPTEYAIAPEKDHVVFKNLIDFWFRFDGATVALRFDRGLLGEHGRQLEQRFREVYGAEFVAAQKGALLYLSKSFTTHPPGEPHFFVKPWAFFRTPPGWSSLVDGYNGDGYDVLRGVIATDQFHATPAVFSIHRADEDIPVKCGAPLLRVFPLPRSLLHSDFRMQTIP